LPAPRMAVLLFTINMRRFLAVKCDDAIELIVKLKDVYGLDLDASASYRLTDKK
jgi:hypothetical protein